MNRISLWARVIRIRLLSASVVAVTTGLAISWSSFHIFNIGYAILTYIGVISLHASVDILNDYCDYKSKIDLMTKGTPFSGGTRVLPDGLLEPKSVYRMGLFFLVFGATIGIFFTVVSGVIIGVILLFAVISTYFYSTRIVNAGLGEIFLIVKGILIVLGSFYVQVHLLHWTPVYTGLIIGLLSSAVVFVNEFPDRAADKAGGRKNIVILLGVANAARFYPTFPILGLLMVVVGVVTRMIPVFALAGVVLSIPLFARTFSLLRSNSKQPVTSVIVQAMANNLMGARILGVALAISFVLGGLGLP